MNKKQVYEVKIGKCFFHKQNIKNILRSNIYISLFRELPKIDKNKSLSEYLDDNKVIFKLKYLAEFIFFENCLCILHIVYR